MTDMLDDNSKELAFVWFTYYLDHPILLRSVRAARFFFPKAKLVIVDDTSEGKAMPKRVVQALARMGCEFVPTTVPRRGNLRGWQCARMIANTYKWVFDFNPEIKMVIKMDSDALLLNPKWIKEMQSNPMYMYGGMRSKCHRSVCGPTYALKRDAAKGLWESYQYEMEAPYLTEEDYEFANRLCRYYKKNDEVLMKVPYSFRGVHPEFIDAVAGMFDFRQNVSQWYKAIAENWQEVVLGYAARPFNGKTKEDRALHVTRENKLKASVMKRLFAMSPAVRERVDSK